jgi:hypothetical protein
LGVEEGSCSVRGDAGRCSTGDAGCCSSGDADGNGVGEDEAKDKECVGDDNANGNGDGSGDAKGKRGDMGSDMMSRTTGTITGKAGRERVS